GHFARLRGRRPRLRRNGLGSDGGQPDRLRSHACCRSAAVARKGTAFGRAVGGPPGAAGAQPHTGSTQTDAAPVREVPGHGRGASPGAGTIASTGAIGRFARSGVMLVFLDFEASSLSERSYAIEVGWVFADGREEDHLIRAAPEWTDWDPSAEAIHGISRNELLERGRDHTAVAQRMV